MAEAVLKHISYFLCTVQRKQAKSQSLSISLRNGHLFSLHCAKETDKKLARAHVTLKVSLKISTMILFANILTDFICCNLKRAPVVLICFMPFTARESTLLEVLHWRGAASNYCPQILIATGVLPQILIATGLLPQILIVWDTKFVTNTAIPRHDHFHTIFDVYIVLK